MIDYTKFSYTPSHVFNDGYKKGWNNAIDKFKDEIKKCCSIVGSCDFEDLERIAKQLKEVNK